MNTISFACPTCCKRLSAPSHAEGKKAKCPACGGPVLIRELPKRTPAPKSARVSPPKTNAVASDGSLIMPPALVWSVVGIGGGGVLALALMLLVSSFSSNAQALPTTDLHVESLPAIDVKPAEPARKVNVAKASAASMPPAPPAPVAVPTAPSRSVMNSVVVLYTDAGQGSGFVVHDRSLIATNVHVIEGAKTVTAVFTDGTEIPVDGICAVSVGHDLAVLHLASPAKVPPLPLQMKQIDPASDVWTMGSPQGLKFTLTKGIVSGYLRWRDIPEHIRPDDPREMDSLWVQTDAAISGGNSGGPLVTASGEVLAINTMASVSPTVQNVNFAIHSKHLSSLLTMLPDRPRPLSALPPKQEASDRSRSQPDLNRQAELDIAAWDMTAETLGGCLLESLMTSLPVVEAAHGKPQAPHVRRMCMIVASETLAAAERLGRIPTKQLNPLLGSYIESQQVALMDLHALTRQVAKMPDNWYQTAEEANQMQAILFAPFEILATEAKAVRTRLEWLHRESMGNPLGFSEVTLSRVIDLKKRLGNANPFGSATTAPAASEFNMPFEFPSPREMCWDSYRRALQRGGDGRVALQNIIALAPGTPDAAKAQKMLSQIQE